MKVKVFHIRLTKENLQSDQEKLNAFLENVKVRKTATDLIGGQFNYWSILIFYEELNVEVPKVLPDKPTISPVAELTLEEKRILDILKEWRFDKSRELNISSYMVFPNYVLISLARMKPDTLEEMKKIKGLGDYKISKFGDEILTLLNSL